MKQIRIFNYLHYSSNHLKTDSNFHLQYDIIKSLEKNYPGTYHWYLTYPKEETNFIYRAFQDFKNVSLIPIRYKTTNSFFRDNPDFDSLESFKDDVDLMFCNTPEVNLSLLSMFQSKGNYINSITYSHWIPTLTDMPMRLYYQNYGVYSIRLKYLLNYLGSQMNYCNSYYGKKIFTDQYRFIDSLSFKHYIDKIIQPLYITKEINFDQKKLEEKKNRKTKEAIILFNHRHNEYTGFAFFMKNIKAFIDKYNHSHKKGSGSDRFKFKLAFTSVGNVDKTKTFDIPEEYFYNTKPLDYNEYLELLIKSDIIIGAHNGENQWSLSFIDGILACSIPIYRKKIFFDEMIGFNQNTELSFNNDIEFQGSLFKVLSNLNYYRKVGFKIGSKFKEVFSWDNKIHDFHKAFQEGIVMKKFKFQGEKLDLTEKYLKDNNYIFWKSLKKIINISSQRPNNIYRDIIKEKCDLKDDMSSRESVLYRGEKPKILRQQKLI